MKFISPRAHSVIGFVVGVALLFAPNIFGFSDVGGAAVLLPRILGVIIILSELTVRGSFSGMGIVPMRAHITTDVIMGLLLALSPWLFSFSDGPSNSWVPHLLVGIVIVLYALATRTDDDTDEA